MSFYCDSLDAVEDSLLTEITRTSSEYTAWATRCKNSLRSVLNDNLGKHNSLKQDIVRAGNDEIKKIPAPQSNKRGPYLQHRDKVRKAYDDFAALADALRRLVANSASAIDVLAASFFITTSPKAALQQAQNLLQQDVPRLINAAEIANTEQDPVIAVEQACELMVIATSAHRVATQLQKILQKAVDNFVMIHPEAR